MKKYDRALFVLMQENERILNLFRGPHDKIELDLLHNEEMEISNAIELLKKEN